MLKAKIIVKIDSETKAKFKEKCAKTGSNMSVEIKRFIHRFLKEK